MSNVVEILSLHTVLFFYLNLLNLMHLIITPEIE